MVEFRPMTQDRYDSWRGESVKSYASEKVKSGEWTPEEAQKESEREFASLLPLGLATPDNYLRLVVDGVTLQEVGMIWYALRREGADGYVFIYDFKIFEGFRRRGYAMQALRLLDRVVGEMGLDSIYLHVFAHNRAARDLYLKAGYEEKDVIMARQLS